MKTARKSVWTEPLNRAMLCTVKHAEEDWLMTIHIKPMWDAVEGIFRVETATFRGLGRIEGVDREAFEAALRKRLPGGENIAISYEDTPKIIPPSDRLGHASGPA